MPEFSETARRLAAASREALKKSSQEDIPEIEYEDLEDSGSLDIAAQDKPGSPAPKEPELLEPVLVPLDRHYFPITDLSTPDLVRAQEQATKRLERTPNSDDKYERYSSILSTIDRELEIRREGNEDAIGFGESESLAPRFSRHPNDTPETSRL